MADDLQREGEIYERVLWCAHRLFTEMAHALAFQMSPMQWLAIRALREHGALPMRQLAAVLGCTRNTVTELVDRLERDGYVTRSGRPRGGRTRCASLTKAGELYGAHAELSARTLVNEILRDMDPCERDQLVRLLAQLAHGTSRRSLERLWGQPAPSVRRWAARGHSIATCRR